MRALPLLFVLACASTRVDQNKALARRTFGEILSEGHFDRAGQAYAPGFKNHGLHRDASLEEDQAAAKGWKQMFPDLTYRIDQVVAEADKVVVLWVGSGTAPGGKKGELRGMTLWRIEGGRIQDEWTEFDPTELNRLLEAAPAGK